MQRNLWRRALLGGLIACTCLFATTAPASAQQQGVDTAGMEGTRFERFQLFYQSALVARANPLGLISQNVIGPRINIWEDNTPLKENTYLEIAFAPTISPAFVRPGLLIEAVPLQIIKLSVLYEYVRWFGAFDSLQSFDSPTAEFDDATRNDIDQAGGSYSASGTVLTLSALLQLAVDIGDSGASIAARSNFRAMRQDMNLDGVPCEEIEGDCPFLDDRDDTVFYDLVTDVMMPNGGWLHTTDTDVLYRPDTQWMLGVRHTWISVNYRNSDFLPGEDRDIDNVPIHRLGPLIVYKINNNTGGTFNEPTVFMVSQFHMQHRYRAGQAVSTAIPYFLAGFAFNGVL